MSKTLIIGLVVVVVVGGAIAGTYYMKGDTGGTAEPGDVTGELTGTGEEPGNGETVPPERPGLNANITEDMCIEITAYVNVAMTFLMQQNTAKATAMEQKVRELEDRYNVTARSDEFGAACNGMIDDEYIQRLNAKTAELLSSMQ